jgi:hypothetical protein
LGFSLGEKQTHLFFIQINVSPPRPADVQRKRLCALSCRQSAYQDEEPQPVPARDRLSGTASISHSSGILFIPTAFLTYYLILVNSLMNQRGKVVFFS